MNASPDIAPGSVAEVQGLYGAFSFPEKLLQKIWLRGDFERNSARLADGRSVRIIHPGKWNLLGGPDFAGARVKFEGAEHETHGDVEVHLRAADWHAHGHASDPAYDRVILHVVLFPPEGRPATFGAGRKEIPILALLPLLHRALEEFAADEAVEALANRPLAGLAEELSRLPASELAELLRRHASARWRQKVYFAGLRVHRLGWESACHHTVLEILGYRFNRAPMLRIATAWPAARWAAGGADVEAIVASESGGWSLQGVRPANHPRTRLRQFAAWMRERPDWPARLLAFAARVSLRAENRDTRTIRREQHLVEKLESISSEICAGAVGGTRLNTLICDGFFPLVAAESGRDIRDAWHHWFCGDLPPWLTSGLRQLGYFDGRIQPACHGAAQGLLGWFLERDAQRENPGSATGRGA
jgi:hypothetical protein